ncbi:hypothetical protein C2845_PM02G21520 [Panicum miliaceum]|uniref:DUF1618 domain-containing protein n=1 Tax=Panicum miliaceum TaxID=4540 RepID=A0A3L6SDM2_PANMI|nr:hypothetical protein C2845_PM02G21520 [Panicum miliaceum]
MLSLRPIRDVTYKNDCIRMIEVEFPDLDGINTDFRWRATVFERMAYANNWYMDCTVDSSMIFLGDHYTFCEMLGCNEKQPTLDMVVSSAPTLDMYNDNVFYMMSKRNAEDPNAWVLAINTRDSTLEKVVPFSAERMFYFDPSYQQCAFSKFLGRAAGAYTEKLWKEHIIKDYETHLFSYVMSVLLAQHKFRQFEKELRCERLLEAITMLRSCIVTTLDLE